MTETKAERLAALFGGNNAFADAIGVDKSVPSRWPEPRSKRGNDGNVPTHYNHRIIEAAERLGVALAGVKACLDEHACPCCKRELEPGQQLDARHVRSALKRG